MSDSPIFIDVSRGEEIEVDGCMEETIIDANIENKSQNDLDEPLQDSRTTIFQDHPANRRIRCQECALFTAKTVEQMTRHVRRVHRGENPFQCTMCEYSTYNKCMFEEHVRIHQGIKPFKCPKCPYRSASKKNAKKHELIHRPDNPLRCKICGFVARHTRASMCHRKTHGDVATVKCDSCNGSFGEEELEIHKQSAVKCSQCEVTMCSRRFLNHHMIVVHGEKRKVRCVEFKCAVCEWTSRSRVKVLLHLIHHPQEVDEIEFDLTVLRKYGIVK